MTVQEAYEQICELTLDGYSIKEFIDEDDIYAGMSIDDLDDKADRYISENSDVIYYSNAIEFLKEHDPSLHDSLELADEYGYSARDLSSEILATLLNEQYMREEWANLRDDIESIIDDIDDEYDEEE